MAQSSSADAVFGARLQSERERLGYTQQEMAGLLGVKLQTYQQWEYARRVPNEFVRETIRKVIATLKPREN